MKKYLYYVPIFLVGKFAIGQEYKKGAGLFDTTFTSNDITLVVLIFLAWSIRMYMERKNPIVKKPTVEDYIFSLVITYAFTGAIYHYAIYKQWEIGFVMFPLLMWAILSIDFIRYLSTKEGNDKLKAGFGALIEFLFNRFKTKKDGDTAAN